MVVTEQVYTYPRRLTIPLSLLSALAVAVTLVWAGRDLLVFLWGRIGLDASLFSVVPYLRQTVVWLRQLPGGPVTTPVDLLPSLVWLALALLLAIVLPNMLPTIRTSARGLLVSFAGDWLPVPWESLQAIKVTEDVEAEKFVLLAEPECDRLTGWHIFYGLLYRLNPRRAFLITSVINDFDRLVKTLLDETDRVARVLDNPKRARLEEDAQSPLFRFLLSPASFFSQKTRNQLEVTAEAPAAAGAPISGAYPGRITALLGWAAVLLVALAAVRAAVLLLQFLALTFPSLLNQPLFQRLGLTQAQLAAPWWMLVAAALLLLAVIGAAAVLRNLLPALEARREGLGVRYGGRWVVVPWGRIQAIKETDLSDASRISLIQATGGLPLIARFSSLLYNGGLAPGVLVTTALSHHDAIMERVILEVTRAQSELHTPADAPIVQSDAPSPLLLLTLRAGPTIDQLVEDIQQDNDTLASNFRMMLRAARPMALLALLPALLGFTDYAFSQGLVPNTRLLLAMFVVFLVGFLEWPLIALGALTLDELAGRGEEGYRPFYLYPLVQLPRALPLVGAIVLMLLGLPFLPLLFWFGAIFWSFLLAAGLWEALYGWRGGQLLAGGLAPVIYQLLLLLVYLLVFR
jgi:hypothetical protein